MISMYFWYFLWGKPYQAPSIALFEPTSLRLRHHTSTNFTMGRSRQHHGRKIVLSSANFPNFPSLTLGKIVFQSPTHGRVYEKKGWQDFVAVDPFISISAFRKTPISPDSPLCLRHSTCTCPWCDKCPGSQEALMVWMSLDTAQHPKRIQKGYKSASHHTRAGQSTFIDPRWSPAAQHKAHEWRWSRVQRKHLIHLYSPHKVVVFQNVCWFYTIYPSWLGKVSQQVMIPSAAIPALEHPFDTIWGLVDRFGSKLQYSNWIGYFVTRHIYNIVTSYIIICIHIWLYKIYNI